MNKRNSIVDLLIVFIFIVFSLISIYLIYGIIFQIGVTSEDIIILICTIITLFNLSMWKKYGEDDKITEIVQSKLPEAYNSLDIAFLYKGKIENKNIMSLVIYLANKGYIKIEERVGAGFFNSKLTYLIKLKEYNGTDSNERLFLEGIFKDDKTEVEINELDTEFKKNLNNIKTNSNSKENKEKINLDKPKFVIPLMYFSLLIVILMLLMSNQISNSLVQSIIAILLLLSFSDKIKYRIKNPETFLSIKIVWWIGNIIIYLIIFACIILLLFLESSQILFFIGIFSCIIIYKSISAMDKRNKFGNEMLSLIKGFIKYIKLSNKEDLESKLLQDSLYFYNILPYAYVLGIDELFYEKFEGIAINPPDWYNSIGIKTSVEINKSIIEMMNILYVLADSTNSTGMNGKEF